MSQQQKAAVGDTRKHGVEAASVHTKTGRIGALDFIRALAIIHIVIYHWYIEWYNGSFLIVPEGVAANIPRLELFKDGGVLGLAKNLFSFLFAYGFTSVNLFLLLSGFVLTYSLLSRPGKIKWFAFMVKRFKRIFIPFYISVAIGVGFLFLRNYLFPAMGAAPIYGWIDSLKLLFFPFAFFDIQLLQKFNGDYWYITLILQLYLLFPLLYTVLKRWGPVRFLAAVFVLTVAYRFVAAYYLDTVPMGVIYPSANSYLLFSFFLPRLFEFGLGMALAWWQVKSGAFIERAGCGLCFLAGTVCAFSGFALNAYRWGWIFSDMVVAAGLFFFFLGIAKAIGSKGRIGKVMSKISDASYEIYLLHHYFLNYFLMPLVLTLGIKNETWFWLLLPSYLVAVFLIGEGGRRISNLAGGMKNGKVPR
jgi:peptidoglycan/LPS O-acetylase OafA/YrhL